MPTSNLRPRSNDEESDSDAAPKRSPKEVAALEKERQLQKMSCLEELLAVTTDMPETDMPLSQADIVMELASLCTVAPLLACMDIRDTPEARLQSAGMFTNVMPPFEVVDASVRSHEVNSSAQKVAGT